MPARPFAASLVAALFLAAVAVAPARAAAKPADPAKPAPGKAKFPAPAVDQILKGWHGLAWGSTLEQFKKKFPQAKQAEGGRWATGNEPDELAGVKVAVEYAFNKKNQLNQVRFDPTDPEVKKTFRKTLMDAGVLKEGGKGNWQNNGVTFAMVEVGGEQLAVAINAKFADPAEKK